MKDLSRRLGGAHKDFNPDDVTDIEIKDSDAGAADGVDEAEELDGADGADDSDDSDDASSDNSDDDSSDDSDDASSDDADGDDEQGLWDEMDGSGDDADANAKDKDKDKGKDGVKPVAVGPAAVDGAVAPVLVGDDGWYAVAGEVLGADALKDRNKSEVVNDVRTLVARAKEIADISVLRGLDADGVEMRRKAELEADLQYVENAAKKDPRGYIVDYVTNTKMGQEMGLHLFGNDGKLDEDALNKWLDDKSDTDIKEYALRYMNEEKSSINGELEKLSRRARTNKERLQTTISSAVDSIKADEFHGYNIPESKRMEIKKLFDSKDVQVAMPEALAALLLPSAKGGSGLDHKAMVKRIALILLGDKMIHTVKSKVRLDEFKKKTDGGDGVQKSSRGVAKGDDGVKVKFSRHQD